MKARRTLGILLSILLASGPILRVSAQAAGPRLPEKIGYVELFRLLSSKTPPLLLDVRTAEEYAEGHIAGAVLAPYDSLEAGFREPDKARPIVVYCRSGRRSAIARQSLLKLGYSNVADFGAVTNWRGTLVGGMRPTP